MSRNLVPLVLALTLSLSACGRDDDGTIATNPELPQKTDAPVNPDRPPAGKMLKTDTSDPSIPSDPSNTNPTMKDRSPPYNTGESAK